ncbi:YdeI/OmpD-associated family protein [Luteimicrobium subarcticum]|uniref:Bacteriocin resistance YdeI/OmpD-like protein n=1 Tax=Luteimicrobium subarcticum TaxID=620910 RepID=A0A2M8WVC0_9MICO|nr:YdeI/OmpD-associated family protein [Luteimicrobium subarcticum]PJI94869.1 bacteriocin resistance YdeI/OmpD-like protein [Luteimicrobium subarcticum]
MPTFRTTLLLDGRNVGIEVPDEVVQALGAGGRPPVSVTLNGFTYRSTVARMKGRYLVPVSAAIRAEAHVEGGEEHDVTVELDAQPRTVEVPDDLAAALATGGVRDAFDALSFSARKEHVRSVTEAKAAATRERRIGKVVGSLGDS